MFLPRAVTPKLISLAKKFPVVVVTGPRQSGKTTLVIAAFPHHEYVSLEDPDLRLQAQDDPRGFLEDHGGSVILDEVQRAPSLLSYIQTRVDRKERHGQYILTGSQNILLQSQVSQTLAGRAAYVTVLPFSLGELGARKMAPLESLVWRGFYPRLHAQKLTPGEWFPNYIRTYVERDVREIRNIGNLATFQKFLKLCAGRTGQLVNASSLASDCGINYQTALSWISVLEASYIIFQLRPHHANLNKRLIKAPKLYFHETGLACSLLGIRSASELKSHFLWGGLFENFVASELVKAAHHAGREPSVFFWRDKTGHEVDFLV